MDAQTCYLKFSTKAERVLLLLWVGELAVLQLMACVQGSSCVWVTVMPVSSSSALAARACHCLERKGAVYEVMTALIPYENALI